MYHREHIAVALIWSIALHLLLGLAVYDRQAGPVIAPAAQAPRLALTLGTESIRSAVPQPPVDGPAPSSNEQGATASIETVAALALPEVNLNPAPRLHHGFTLDVASLALQVPMDARQRRSLQAALNQVVDELPGWLESHETRLLQGDDQHYQLSLERRPPEHAMALERAVLRVSTEVEGLSLEAAVPVTRMAFSHFAQVVDYWDPDVSLAGDSVFGSLHLNSALRVRVDGSSKPRVSGMTTVAGGVHIEGPGRRADIFPNGLQTRARKLPLPQQPIDTAAFADGERLHRIDKSSQLVFEADGSYRWKPLDNSAPEQRVVPTAHPWLVLADKAVELRVEGVIRDSVLVYSPERISITGGLSYARDPRVGISSDFLGLVSDGNVEIAAPELTGPGDLQLDAAIFAGRQFRVRHYRNRGGGILSVYGSITAGSLSATEPRFVTSVRFDPRLEEQRPAHFPMTDRYRIDAGEVAWTVVKAGKKTR